MAALADIFTGGDNIERTANSAADQIGFNPFNINGGSAGGVNFDEESGQINLTPGQLEQQFGGLLSQLGGGFLQNAGGQASTLLIRMSGCLTCGSRG